MRSNSEFVAQAIAAIPLWRAFLDKKEAEQDALLAEVLAEKPKPALLSSLTARFSRRTAAKGEDEPITEQPVPIIEEAITDEDEKILPFSLDDDSPSWVTQPDKVPKVEASKGDDPSEREAVLTEDRGKKEVVSSNDDNNERSNENRDLGDGNHKDEVSQFKNIFN